MSYPGPDRHGGRPWEPVPTAPVAVEVAHREVAEGLRAILDGAGFDVLLEGEQRRAKVLVTDRPRSRNRAKARVLLVLRDPPTPARLVELLAEVAGIVLLGRHAEAWVSAVRAVAEGGTWLDHDPSIAGEVVSAVLGERDQPHGLSRQEARVLRAVEGRTYAEAAAHLGLSPETVKSHLHRAYAKLGVHDRDEALRVLRDGA